LPQIQSIAKLGLDFFYAVRKTVGMNKLKQYLDDHKITITAFAILADTTPATISRLCAGILSPSLDLATKIERLTCGKVLAVSWVPEESEKEDGNAD
jgi:transcriptional regulator with XRE-family HTH domain